MNRLPTRVDLLREYLNWFWLRPENALMLALRGEKYASTFDLFKGKTIDISCGDGAFSFIASGGKISSRCDMFNSINITQNRHGNFDAFDHYDQSYIVEVASTPSIIYDYGTDWKQTLLNKASALQYYDNLICHDNNNTLPFEDNSFGYVYSNSAYWVDQFEQHIEDLIRITKPGGSIILELKTRDAIALSASTKLLPFLGTRSCDILDAGRISTWQGLRTKLEYESVFNSQRNIDIIRVEPIYGDTLSQIWDVGLRPLFAPLARLANSVDKETRLEVKEEFCNTIFDLTEYFISSYVPDETRCIEWLYVIRKCF